MFNSLVTKNEGKTSNSSDLDSIGKYNQDQANENAQKGFVSTKLPSTHGSFLASGQSTLESHTELLLIHGPFPQVTSPTAHGGTYLQQLYLSLLHI